MKIEGYFGKIKNANETVEKLKNAGFKNAIVDLNDHYVDERNVQTNLPGTETSPSLSALVLESDGFVANRRKAPMLAASPMVSGMGKFEEIADYNCKVIVETEEVNKEKVEQILKEAGGEMDNPNIEIPKGLENVDLL